MKHNNRTKPLSTTIFFLIMIICFQNAAGQNAVNKTKIAIDSIIEKKMKDKGLVGVGASIIIDKKIVWSKGYGYADKENKKPFTINTTMNIGSVAKNFIGVCLMRAIEEKKLSLDENINKYLPFKVINPYYPNEIITLRNLTTHTSSLADRYPFYDDSYIYGQGDATEELGDFLKNYFVAGGKYYTQENFLNHKPGSYYEYSNMPAALAGYIVEIAMGKKLNAIARQEIFKPLKMDNTGWFLSDINLEQHTKLYDKSGDTLKPIPLYSFPSYPEGGVRTSVYGLSKYFIALLNEGVYDGARILKKESVAAMQKFQFTDSNKPENVNLAKLNSGIFWATKMGATRIGHNGSDPGVRVFMLSDLSKEISVVLFVNTSLSDDEANVYFELYDDIYKYGKTLKH